MNVKDFAEKYFKAEHEAWFKGNFKPLEELDDPNMVIHMPPLPDMVGSEVHKQQIMRFLPCISDMTLDFRYLTGEKTLFVCSLKQTYRIIKEIPGWPAAQVGKKLIDSHMTAVRVKNGRAAEVWTGGSFTFTD
jgi:hypothetical protein